MVDVKEYMSNAGGQWLRAVNVKVGDILTILGEGELDDHTFEKAYLNIPVRLARTDEAYTVRLGTKNVTRIAETLGSDTKTWVGNALSVLSIEQYQGLGQKGMLLGGVKAAKQATIPIQTVKFPESVGGLRPVNVEDPSFHAPTQSTGEETVKRILAKRPDLTREGILQMIRLKRESTGKLLTEEGAAYMVANDLGVDPRTTDYVSEEPSLSAILVLQRADTLVKEDISMSRGDWDRHVKPEIQKELLQLGLAEERESRFCFTEKAKKVLSEAT